MKFVLKILVFIGIILVGKFTKEKKPQDSPASSPLTSNIENEMEQHKLQVHVRPEKEHVIPFRFRSILSN